jgi:hypothetical protein
MKSFDFPTEHRYEGHKALVSVRLTSARIPTWVEMTVDSGAEISLLNRSLAKQLEIRIEDGEFFSLEVASGHIAIAYRHNVPIDLLGHAMTIPVLLCPEWDTQNLLGMEGFFDQMVIAFDHAQKRIYF